MAKILLVDDDPAIQAVVRGALTNEGHEVVVAATGEEGLQKADAEPFDLLLLDVGLPSRSGLEVAMELRQRFAAPILMISGRDTEGDILSGLTMGADDYITKPFSIAILAAKVRASLRRRPAPAGDPPAAPAGADVLRCGPLQLDPHRWQVTLGEHAITLTVREFKIVQCLLQHRNMVLSREHLIERVWGPDFEGSDRAVDVSLSRLRRHLLDLPGCPISVRALAGVGYKVVVQTDST